jgi:hypothetical protein
MLLTDRPLPACVALWVLAVVFVVYAPFCSMNGPPSALGLLAVSQQR